jgi:parallel beta-helix repeat protein
MSWKQVLPIGLVLVLSGSGLGQTYVEGDVSGVWSLTGSPYIVIGDCNVLEGTTLTIEPGVEVQFSGLHYILVVGTLVAEGTRSDTIVFTSYGTVHNPGDWRYVKINGSSAQDSRFKYCDVSYAQWGIWVADSECEIRRCGVHGSDGGIKINNSDVTVERCHLYGNNDQGVYASGSSSITVRRCLVEDNNDEGIETGGSTGGFIEWNSVFRNGLQGILVDGASNMWVNRNAVADNLHGLYFQDAHVSAKHNSISNNDQHGVFFLNSQLIFSSNIVDRNGNRGLYNINSVAVLSFNDVWANGTNYEGCSPGAGSFSDDPRYVSDPFDFHLQSDSPCIDAGDPSSPLDPDGTRADVGAYYYDQNNPPEILSYGPETLDTVYLDDEQ